MASVDPLICLCVLLFLGIPDIRPASGEHTRTPGATAPGDIIIGATFPIHEGVEKTGQLSNQPSTCVRYDKRGLAKSLAMINAIEIANKSPPLADLNVTLGYRIHDSCSDISTALRAIAEFSRQARCHAGGNDSTPDQTIVALIGATFSEMSIAIARQLTMEAIPQISYSSTAVVLSDKKRFPTFLRTVPNDDHQTAAMVRLLKKFDWNWVGIVVTDGDYGRSALDSFVSQATETGICVAFKLIFPHSVTSLDGGAVIRRCARTVLDNPKVQVIVAFTKTSQMKYLYKEMKAQLVSAGRSVAAMRRVWVASDSWSSSKTVQETVPLAEIGQVVGFTFKSGSMVSFYEYIRRLEEAGHENTGTNAFLREFYQVVNDSEASGDTPLVSQATKILRQHADNDTTLSIEMAVSAIVYAVASICRSKDCKAPGGLQPLEMLEALPKQKFELDGRKYEFDANGDINQGYNVIMWTPRDGSSRGPEVVAEYLPHSNNFVLKDSSTVRLSDLQAITSKCSNSCIPGQFKKTAEGQHVCCYECINCTVNYFSNDTDMDLCLSCDMKTEWSPEGSSECLPKALRFFSWEDKFAVVLLAFSALGIILVLMVSSLFLHQYNTPVVKAAGGPLSQVILFSLAVSFVSAILFAGRPNSYQCKARQVLFGISFTLCVACILVKSLRILLAFQLNLEMPQVLRKFYQPYVIIAACVALQVVICICWLVLKSPFNYVISYPTYLLEDCHEGSYLAFGVMLGYIALLAFVCFVCAFKGRKLPEQYNEARFITFSMLLYLISWMLFVPVYVTTSGKYLPAVEMVVILISNYGIFSCHFLPKCYIIIFKKEQNTNSAFRKGLYEYSSKTSNSISISGSSVSEQTVGSPQQAFSTQSFPSSGSDLFRSPTPTIHSDWSRSTSFHSSPLKRRGTFRRSTSI